MVIKRFLAGLAVLASLGLFASPGWATTSITINNFSFESPSPSSYQYGCPTSWGCSADFSPWPSYGANVPGSPYDGGVYVPVSPTQYQMGATNSNVSSDGLTGERIVPNGSQALFMATNLSGTTPDVVQQITQTKITSNNTYTMSAYAGARADGTNAWAAGWTPQIEILAYDPATLVTSVVDFVNTSNPDTGNGTGGCTNGCWKDFTLQWVANSSFSAYWGDYIGVALVVPGRSSGDGVYDEVDWDAVTLAEQIPEPASILLFGTALAIFIALRRRKSTSPQAYSRLISRVT